MSAKAMEQYRIAVLLDPNYTEAHVNLGMVYLGMGARDLARSEFVVALKTAPDDMKARRFLEYLSTGK